MCAGSYLQAVLIASLRRCYQQRQYSLHGSSAGQSWLKTPTHLSETSSQTQGPVTHTTDKHDITQYNRDARNTCAQMVWYSRVQHPTRHSIGHFGDDSPEQ